MDTFLKATLAIGGLFLIVPLAVWGGTGSLSHAWFALKRYLLVMAIIVVPVATISGIWWAASRLN